MSLITEKLEKIGIQLPVIPTAVANYMPYVRNGDEVYISGQLPLSQGQLLYKGVVGKDLTIEEGQKAARLCAINILACLNAACDGDLNRVEQCIRIGGFVQSDSFFSQHPQIINGASDLMVEVFGDKGRHARAAVGVASLPLGASVEVEALFRIKA